VGPETDTLAPYASVTYKPGDPVRVGIDRARVKLFPA
jgi:hypothetical protein